MYTKNFSKLTCTCYSNKTNSETLTNEMTLLNSKTLFIYTACSCSCWKVALIKIFFRDVQIHFPNRRILLHSCTSDELGCREWEREREQRVILFVCNVTIGVSVHSKNENELTSFMKMPFFLLLGDFFFFSIFLEKKTSF
jgi:hypothetical protein